MAIAKPGIPMLEQVRDYPFRLLPDGVYRTDEAEFRERFVSGFPASKTRNNIYEGLVNLRREAMNQGISATQWVDGSFVEGKLDPRDVDLVSFCDYDRLNAMEDEAQRFVSDILGGGEESRSKYLSHSFLVPACSEGHPYYETFEKLRCYWRKWFGRTRTVQHPSGTSQPRHEKGIVELPMGHPMEIPEIRVDKEEE